MASTASRSACGSASSGVMSRNRIPGLGQSGMSRMYRANSMRSLAIQRTDSVRPAGPIRHGHGHDLATAMSGGAMTRWYITFAEE